MLRAFVIGYSEKDKKNIDISTETTNRKRIFVNFRRVFGELVPWEQKNSMLKANKR